MLRIYYAVKLAVVTKQVEIPVRNYTRPAG